MKRLYTMLMLALVAVTASVQAQDNLQWMAYTEPFQIVVNGEETPAVDKTFYMARQVDGKYGLRIENFALDDGMGNIIPVGNITLMNVDVSNEANGDEKLSVESSIYIEEGSDPAIKPDEWIGPMITAMGAIPVILNGTKRGNHVYIELDIDMSDTLGQIVKVKLGNPINSGDGIDCITPSPEDKTVFTLYGVRTTTSRPGIYIVSGRKVLVR